MKRFITHAGFTLIFSLVTMCTMAQETLTNESIASLIQAKVSGSLIINKIKSSANAFDLSSDKLIELKSQKIPDNILREMMMACRNLPAMKNEDVIKLNSGKISKDIILKKISLSSCNFNTSTDALIALKTAEVPESVIKVMMTTPAAEASTTKAVSENHKPHPMDIKPPANLSTPGIYYEQFSPKIDYVMIEPTTTNQTKKGGFGEAMGNHYSGGISGISTRVGLAGSRSSTVVEDDRPVFYFYLSMSGKDVNQVKESTEEGVASPKEFVLVKATQNKNGREIQIARRSAFSDEQGFAKGVVMFEIKKVSDRLYKVYFNEDLPAGEYAFYYNKSSDQRSSLKLYDFSLKNNITVNK